MHDKLKRYSNDIIVEYLASRYALGQLSVNARLRLEELVRSGQYTKLKDAIKHHQSLLSQLDDAITPIQVDDSVFTKLQASINKQSSQTKNTSSDAANLQKAPNNVRPMQTAKSTQKEDARKQTTMFKWLPMAASFALFAILLSFLLPTKEAQLSYIAVMTDSSEQAALVAATYGDSLELSLDLVNLPALESESSYELWVTSKTDKQARSLGIIDPSQKAFSRELSEAEWRLIQDSATLLVTVEEYGGSSIGEPMGDIVAEGLCVRLTAWEA